MRKALCVFGLTSSGVGIGLDVLVEDFFEVRLPDESLYRLFSIVAIRS